MSKAVKWTGFAFILAICLFGESVTFLHNSFLAPIFRDFLAVTSDRQLQWLILLCVFSYFTLFALIRSKQPAESFWRLDTTSWLAVTFVVGGWNYAFNYPSASQSTQLFTLLTGVTLGRGVQTWSSRQKRREEVLRLIFYVFTLLIFIASLWHTDIGRIFEYRSQPRWTGPWDNPNIFGLLMGMGIVLAIGSVIPCPQLSIADQEKAGSQKCKIGKFFCVLLCFFAAILLVRGLLHSYSRGAWMALLFGLAYLMARRKGVRQRAETETTQIGILCGSRISRSVTWISRKWLMFFVIILSSGVLVFWQVRHSKHQSFTSRAFSVVNANDISWRNRLTAWKGALQITAEHPWLGAGWNRPELLYEQYYLPSRLDESSAIKMNDYLMLGATLGAPALFCFCMYLWLSFTGKWESRERRTEIGELEWLKAVCRAGALVLAVGFWFDGGLFKLATASTFWILLELGRADLVQQKATEETKMYSLVA